MSVDLRDRSYFTGKLLALGRLVRSTILEARRAGAGAGLAGVSKVTSADTIYEIDAHVEPVIERFCSEWAEEVPLVLIAEGIGEGGKEGKAVFPHGMSEEQAQVRIICDPIDGTRGIMYDKRSAWFLAGAAPNKGERTRLSDVFAAAQVEIPTSKQHVSDVLWAVKGEGIHGVREALYGGPGAGAQHFRPSAAETLDHGFASVSNFFPGTKVLASRLMEEIVAATVGAADVTRGTVFDDQYISTGGQLYELICGHDRFIADLRPVFYEIQKQPAGLCCHPYDMAALLIAREAGIEITDGAGQMLDGPLDVESPLAWVGYANGRLRERIEPVLLKTLEVWRNVRPT